MRKYFKQFVIGNGGDNSFHYDNNVSGRNGLVMNAVFENSFPLDVSMAYIEVTGLSTASELSFYWDKTGVMTNYSNLNNAEKLDFALTSNNVMRFDITRVIATLLKDGTPTKQQQYIIAGKGIPTSGVSCSISVYYEYKMGLKGEQATVPFELKTANGAVNLGDGGLSLNYVANSGFGRVPASVKFVYNSNMTTFGCNAYLDNYSFHKINYNCGSGWKLNFQQYIIYKTTDDSFLSDGESVGYLTWVNAQGNQILFKKRFYATVNGERVYLTWPQVTRNEDGTYSCKISDVVYEVTREYACDELYTLKDEDSNITITDVAGNKSTFSTCGLLNYDDVLSYRLTKIEDSYANAANVGYDEDGKLVSISSVGGNTIEIKYGEDGLISQVIDNVSSEKTVTTNIVHNGELIAGFTTAENNSDLTITYDGNKNIQTVLDPIGNGYNLVFSGDKVTGIKNIAKNGGIENGKLISLQNSDNTITIEGVKYKYINLYEIAYADRYAKLIEKRNNKNSIYLFDYFGRNINTYANNYDGEGYGNPQSESFSINQPNVEINTQNVFECYDLCQSATCDSSTCDLLEISNEEERFAMKEFVEKMNSLKTQNKGVNTNVYYASCNEENDYSKPYETKKCSVDFTLSASDVNTLKNSQSLNFVLSGWAMAKAFPMASLATGYDVIEDNSYEFDYNKSDASEEFYWGLDTARYDRTFSLYVKIDYGTFVDLSTASFDFNNHNFQQLQIPVVLRHKDRANIQNVTVGVTYDNNNGTVYVYGMSMKSGNWNLAQYDNYKLYSFTANKEKEDNLTYYEYNNHMLSFVEMTQTSSADSYLESDNDNIKVYRVDYTYNEHKRVSKSVDNKGFVIEYTYNTHGDLTDKKSYRTLENGQTDSYVGKKTFEAATGFVKEEFNPFGVLAKSNVYGDGVLKSATSADSAKISYNYDSELENITKMTANVPNEPIVTDWKYVRSQNTNLSDYGSNVRYDYDGFGRVTKIYLDGEEYCSIDYVNERQKIVTYANGEREKINLNEDDTQADIYQTDNPNSWGSTTVELSLNKYGAFEQLEDNVSGTKIKASYDDRGLPEKMAVENKDDHFYDVIVKNEYDQTGKVTRRTYEQENVDTDVVNYNYQDEFDGKVTNIDHSYLEMEHIEYDDLQRVSHYGISGNDEYVDYTYLDGGNNATSNLIASERHVDYNEEFIDNYAYEYDTIGRLTKVTNNDILVKRYYYDSVGRLIREDNKDFNKTFEIVYDKVGNILKRKEYAYTEGTLPADPKATYNYTYDETHKNRLLSYNGEECKNYVLGNPNTYRGKTAVWTKVHRLASLGSVSFEYDYAGIRTKKIVNGVERKYGINGSTIVSEQKGSDATTRINYYYGHNGVTGFKYLDNCYYYKKNFLGDIIGIYDDNDNLVARYVYDAWGNHKVLNPSENGEEDTSATFIGNINPFRYRSYYFDVETGLYYLQSRYYDPEVGRFISMDQVEYLAPDVVNGLNLYVYCLNNPVMGYDPEGTWNWGKFWKGVASVALFVVGGAGYAIGVNIVKVIESNSYVSNNNVAPMTAAEVKEKNITSDSTLGLSREEKLAYIRYLKKEAELEAIKNSTPNKLRNWSEAEMLREFEYHDKGYELVAFLQTSVLGQDAPNDDAFPAKNLKRVDFEEEQNLKTYALRFIGNMFLW